MLGRVMGVGLVVVIILLFVLLQLTTPSTIGPLGILAVFVLIYLLALGVLSFLLYGMSGIMGKLRRNLRVKRPFKRLTLLRSYYFASVLALAPVIFMGMQSVGEVGIYDVILVGLFVTIACIYIAKRTI